MIKLLIGGSPCTYWSIAQKNNRETTAEGLGWELFKNYLIAKEKFKPDFFLYENNKSAAQAIKDQIKHELHVWDETLFTEDSGARYIEINSALVSAQNRQRFYVHNCGDVKQPEDRGILLRDILETGCGFCLKDEKSYVLTASYYKGDAPDRVLEKSKRTMVAEPCCLRMVRTDEGKALRKQYEAGEIHHGFNEHRRPEPRTDGKTNTISTVQKDNMIIEPVGVGFRNRREDDGKLYRRFETSGEPKANCLTTVQTDSMCAEPVRIGTIESKAKNKAHDSKQYRVYSPDGKSTTICGCGGGVGAKTGLYAVPAMPIREATTKGFAEIEPGDCVDMTMPNSKTRRGRSMKDKCNCLMTGNQYYQYIGTKDRPIYEVKDGLITIKGKQYPIKLIDGYYIIRKLTVTECCRLQTMPDDYCRAVSNSQAYKGLGNGWTAEVIIHILNGALKDVPRDEEIVVLSMYDGIGTGRYCLDKMGFTNVKYYAYEIDKYAMQVSASNFPDIIQLGDAFQLREDDWCLPRIKAGEAK